MYLIGYLQTNQLVMACSGIESGIADSPLTHFKWSVGTAETTQSGSWWRVEIGHKLSFITETLNLN